MSSLLARYLHWSIVGRQRYVYHILTDTVMSRITDGGGLILPRNKGTSNEYSNPELVSRRSDMVLSDGLRLHDAVPFYLSPRQPMFCRLVREGFCTSRNIIAVGYDFESLIETLSARYVLFTTNPVYDGCRQLSSWKDREELDWRCLRDWRWNDDADSKDTKLRKSANRQAEVDIFCSVPLALADHVVVDASFGILPEALRLRRIDIECLSVW